MQKIIQQIKNNKKTAAAIVLLFIVALLYNTLSPYTTDDFSYMFSFADGERITNPLQIISSLWNHYLNINGRILPHVFVQFFMIFPKWVFNFINAAVFVGLVWLVMQCIAPKKFHALLFFAIPIAFWCYIPAYGPVFLWMTGSANYCWAFFFSLIYMKFYIDIYQNPSGIVSGKKLIGFSVYSLFFGAYSEMVSFPVIFICFVLASLTMMEEKNIKKYLKYVIPIVTGAVGYLTLVLCPGAVTRKEEFSVGLLFKSFIDVFENYYQCAKPLLTIWAILLVIGIYFKIEKKHVKISICFLAISLISMSMLSVASYVVARHYAISTFYLLCAIVVLMQSLRGRGRVECISYCICAYVIATSIWSLWEGTYDIYDVQRRNLEREAYIYEQVENGAEELTVSIIKPLTKYSCKYDLMDIRTDDADPWPNAEIAKYYGLKKIYGKEAD